MLSIICGVTLSILLNPNPHRLINGAQVISKAPPDFLEISSALLNTSVKPFVYLHILVIIDFSDRGVGVERI